MMTDMILAAQNFLMEVKPKADFDKPPEIHMDASSAIHAAVVPAMLPKFKHIPIHAQKLRTHTQYGDVVLRKIDSASNTADQGTKPYSSGPDYLKKTEVFMITQEKLKKMGYVRHTSN